MNDDRRSPGASNRRKSCRTEQRSAAGGEASANSRENVLRAREHAVYVREGAMRRHEVALAAQSAGANDSANRETGDETVSGTADRNLNVKLRQANERLVIASIQSQIMAEEVEKSKAAMVHLANHDFLTNLPNRRQLHERITQAIAIAKRHDMKLAVLFLDLDRFKIVNDSLGHAVGDQLLQAVAQRLKSAIRSSDTISRQGGDEFVMVLSDVNQETSLALNVKKIHQTITAPYSIAGHDLRIGATIGISIFPDDGEDSETLIRNADAAMYHAKKNGRNSYQFFRTELTLHDEERQHVEASLYQAIDEQQFVLFYQAQIDLDNGAVTGAEALIRWRHPERGLLLPARFIPVAEDCGAIVPIGRWALREACVQAQSWLHAGMVFNVMAVNISASEFEHRDFLDYVRTVLQETGMPANRLELELTETVLMKNIDATASILATLRSMGVRISIDDFGTGYSSLSYLKRLPVDTMKVDQSFVRDISFGGANVLINAVIGIGKSLGHHVVAEGVETPQQLAFLRGNHCPAAQGFYLNAPMAAIEFTSFLEQGMPPGIWH